MDPDHLPKRSIVINANSGIEMKGLSEPLAVPPAVVVSGSLVVVVTLVKVEPVTVTSAFTLAFLSAAFKSEATVLKSSGFGALDEICEALEAGAVTVYSTVHEPFNILAMDSSNRRDSVAVTLVTRAGSIPN